MFKLIQIVDKVSQVIQQQVQRQRRIYIAKFIRILNYVLKPVLRKLFHVKSDLNFRFQIQQSSEAKRLRFFFTAYNFIGGSKEQ